MAILLKKKQQLLQSLSSNFNFKFKWNTPSSWMSSVVPKRHVHTDKALLKKCRCQNGTESSSFYRLTPENLSAGKGYFLNGWLDGYQEFSPSCDGLLYVCNKSGEAAIWNITTEEGIELPAHAKSASCIVDACALGFDSASQDYKVVRFCHNSIVEGNRYCRDEELTTGVELYSFKTNSWKVLDRRDVYDFQSPSVYAKGFSYWVVDESCILSFNFGDESFSRVAPPPHSKEGHVFDLVEFDGWLVCFVYSRSDTVFQSLIDRNEPWSDSKSRRLVEAWGKRAYEAWIMRGDGSWRREGMVHPVQARKPLGFLSEGLLLFENAYGSGPLKVYDFCANTFKGVPSITTFRGKMELFPYVESRVPMNEQLQLV